MLANVKRTVIISFVIGEITAQSDETFGRMQSRKIAQNKKMSTQATEATAATKKLTVTLTNRAPVTIAKDNWPTRAQASWKDWDNTHECQANRTWNAWIKVRQHIDGRTLIYAAYDYSSQYENEGNESMREGCLVTPSPEEYPESMRDESHDWTGERVVQAIRDVGELMLERSACEKFRDLIAECIADLPAVELE